MKMKKISAVAIAAALLFASCSNDDNNAPEVKDGRVKFTSGLSATAEATTRVSGAFGDQWDGNEHIGIYMIGHNDAQIVENAANIEYATTSVGASATFSPENTTETIYYPVNSPTMVDFIAYHPYDASVSNYVYPVNVADQSNQSEIALMTSRTSTGYDKTNTAVDLQFGHQLVKVVLNVTPGPGVSDLTGLEVKIKGMNTAAEFNIFDATLSNISDIAPITPYKQPSAYSYEAILLPVGLNGSQIVEFAVGGNTYKWVIHPAAVGTSLNKGNRYTFDIMVQKARVSVSGKISPWTNLNVGGVAQ